MQKYDVITFGSASEDIFVFAEKFFNKKLCFPLDDKVEMDQIIISVGGGGTNAAATLALQGLKTAYCGSVGKDYAGFSILLGLKRFKISTEFLGSLDGKTTNHSVVLSKKEKGRVILVYRDASNYLLPNFSLKNLQADWFYIAPLGGELAKKTEEIINYAKLHNIKIAFNPGKEQIKELKKKIKDWLPRVDVLLPNEKEAKMLFGNYKKPEEMFKKIKPYLKGIIVTSDDEKAIAFNGQNIYRAEKSKIKATDKTGGGDAFSSGFVAGLIKTGDIVRALQLAAANCDACVQKWGAQEGLLQSNQKYQKINIEISKF